MRDLVNPNRTNMPVEVTREEVARAAKSGCAHCHGAGCIAWAAKTERGQLKADPKWSICRCIARRLHGRADVREIAGRLHWLPVVRADATVTL